MESARSDLLELLCLEPRGSCNAKAERIEALIADLERSAPADLSSPETLAQLEAVWELRWSSSRQPYLAVAPWLENLQCLAPSQGRGMNLLRPAGPLGTWAGIAVEASIAVEPAAADSDAHAPVQRVRVQFQRGGWLGPRAGQRQLHWLRKVNQSFPAWLDITVLDDELRICRGNAGTVFALLRRPELNVSELLARLE
jgi:hypothetical protein